MELGSDFWEIAAKFALEPLSKRNEIAASLHLHPKLRCKAGKIHIKSYMHKRALRIISTDSKSRTRYTFISLQRMQTEYDRQ